MSADITIRAGGTADVPAVLALLDKAVTWLVAQGRPGQWGTRPLSAEPRQQARVSGWAREGGLHLAYLSGQPVGALGVGTAPGYVAPATEPELYVNLMVSDHEYAGRGIGGRLLNHARDLAREAGTPLLRVDCYAGDDGALIRYYEKQGFRRVAPFSVELADDRVWPGQLLEDRLTTPEPT